MPWTRYKPGKRAVFTMLMLLSAVSLFVVPKDWSDALKHVGQLAVPVEDPLYRLSRGAAASLADLDPAAGRDQRDTQALLHALASQVAENERLREENARLRGLREPPYALATGVPLLPAKIVARDLVAWRDSLLASGGSARGVRRKDWVASRFFVDRGRRAGVEEGTIVLANECLLGRVEQVSPYMARVQLFSDINSARIGVRIGNATEDPDRPFEFVDYPCSLHGLGRGRMIVADVPYKYVAATAGSQGKPHQRRIRLGDLALSVPGQLGLSSPLVIGRVTKLEEDPRKRLVISLLVEPVIPIDQISDVIIIPLVPDRTPLPD